MPDIFKAAVIQAAPVLFDTPLGRIGNVICWQNYIPLLRMSMYTEPKEDASCSD